MVISRESRGAFSTSEPYFLGLGLALFLQKKGHDLTLLLADCNEIESLPIPSYWKEKGLRVESLQQTPDALDETLHPSLLKNSWQTYRWLKSRNFNAVFFQDDSSVGLISIQAKKLKEAFASTHLAYCLHGPAQWSTHFWEHRQMLKRDTVINYSVQYGVENSDHLILPATYFLDRIRASGWRQPERVSVLPVLSNSKDRVPNISGRLRHLIYPVHHSDQSSFVTFVHVLSLLSDDFSDLRVSFLCYGSPKLQRQAKERLSSDLQAYLPRLHFDFIDTTKDLPDWRDSVLWLFSPLWLNLPGFILEKVNQEEFILIGRTAESMSLQGLAPNLVDWNISDLTLCLRKALEGHAFLRASGLVRLEAEKAWEDYLLAVSAQIFDPISPPVIQKIRVSICVAHFNKASYLAAALESLGTQTYPQVEVIVVDDASTDAKARDVFKKESICRASPDWQFISLEENHGPGHARNVAAERATGSHLIFFDADDIAFPDMVERLVQAILQPNVDCVGGTSHRLHEIMGSRERTGVSTYVGGSLESAFRLPPAGSVFIISKKIFDQIDGFKADLFHECDEDWNFHCKLLAQEYRLHVLPEPVFAYRSILQSRSSIVIRNMSANLEPFWQGTQQMQKNLLLFTLDQARGADNGVRKAEKFELMASEIRVARFLVRIKRNIFRLFRSSQKTE